MNFSPVEVLGQIEKLIEMEFNELWQIPTSISKLLKK